MTPSSSDHAATDSAARTADDVTAASPVPDLPGLPEEVAGHPLTPRLREATDPALRGWIAELPATVATILAAWGLQAAAPFQPGGSSAWVAPVRDRQGRDLALKVAWAHEDSRFEAAGMQMWQGHGAARVHRVDTMGPTALLLMDRVRSGTTLAASAPWPVRDEVVADLLRRLWRAPADPALGLPTLEEMCRRWEVEARHRLSEGAGVGLLSPGIVDHGLGLYLELASDGQGGEAPLATDLHHENVLAADGDSGRDWVLIDPKPHVGDPHYDVLQHMLNDDARMVADPAGFAARMADLAGLDPRRVQRWMLARCVQESGDFEVAPRAVQALLAAGVE